MGECVGQLINQAVNKTISQSVRSQSVSNLSANLQQYLQAQEALVSGGLHDPQHPRAKLGPPHAHPRHLFGPKERVVGVPLSEHECAVCQVLYAEGLELQGEGIGLDEFPERVNVRRRRGGCEEGKGGGREEDIGAKKERRERRKGRERRRWLVCENGGAFVGYILG